MTDDTQTPEQIEQHMARLIRLNERARRAEDATTVEWTAVAIERCEKLLYELYQLRLGAVA